MLNIHTPAWTKREDIYLLLRVFIDYTLIYTINVIIE